jgi:hypothetical protein
MVEKKVETVTLVAPNGQRVSVAESKKVERLAAGYRLPAETPEDKPTPAKGRAAQPVND